MEDSETIAIVKFIDGICLNIICSDYYFDKDSGDYLFEDDLGIVHAIVPRERVVCIYEQKYKYA